MQAAAAEIRIGDEPVDPRQRLQEPEHRRRVQRREQPGDRRVGLRQSGLAPELLLLRVVEATPRRGFRRGKGGQDAVQRLVRKEPVDHDVGKGRGAAEGLPQALRIGQQRQGRGHDGRPSESDGVGTEPLYGRVPPRRSAAPGVIPGPKCDARNRAGPRPRGRDPPPARGRNPCRRSRSRRPRSGPPPADRAVVDRIPVSAKSSVPSTLNARNPISARTPAGTDASAQTIESSSPVRVIEKNASARAQAGGSSPAPRRLTASRSGSRRSVSVRPRSIPCRATRALPRARAATSARAPENAAAHGARLPRSPQGAPDAGPDRAAPPGSRRASRGPRRKGGGLRRAGTRGR